MNMFSRTTKFKSIYPRQSTEMQTFHEKLSTVVVLAYFLGAYAQTSVLTSTLVVPSLSPTAPVIGPAQASSSQPPAANTSISPSSTSPAQDESLPSTWSLDSLPLGVPKTASGKPIPCSPKNTKLNPTTHKLISECVETTFCAAPPGAPVNATGLGVCFPRLCRRDEFPFGYGKYGGDGQPADGSAVELPPMCAGGQYCPDNGSGCRPLQKLGEECELARDEQCEALQEGGKSVCLNLICTAATAALDEPCAIENTTYISDINRGAAGGGQFTTFVMKHNCISPGLFCDPTPPDINAVGPTCQQTKNLGDNCRFNMECESNNCLSPSNKCGIAPQTPIRIAPWYWAVTVLALIIAMTAALLLLLFLHRRRQYARYQEVKTYYYEQISLRRSILALHAAAAEQRAVKRGAFNEKQKMMDDVHKE